MAKGSNDFEQKASASFTQERFDEALKIYREGRRIFPDDPNLIIGEALCHFRMGDYPIARDILEALRGKGPVNPAVLLGLAHIYACLGRRRDAVIAARQLLKAINPHAETAELFGEMFLAHRNPRESARCFIQAIRWKQDDAAVWIGLAFALLCMKRRRLGRRLLESACRRLPEDVELLNELGNFRYDDGEEEGALDLWRRIPCEKQYDSITLKRMLQVMKAPMGDREGRALRGRLNAVMREEDAKANDAEAMLRRFCGAGKEGA